LLVAALLLPFMATGPMQAVTPRAQPILLQMAAERPDATLSVIVQKTVKDTQVESLVARLGGTVTADLHIINAFGAILPAKAILKLSQADGVRWVSLDAPVVETALGASADGATCAVTYAIPGDWGSGFTASVTITNTGSTAINGWTLTWTFPGNQQITNLWNGTYTQSGTSVSVKNASYNATIAANGGTVNLGFNANYSGTNAKPTSFALNGVTCGGSPTNTPVDTTQLKNAYVRAIGADKVWNESPYLQGQGIGVAVVDSGINPQQDLYTVMGVNRLVASAAFNNGYNQSVYDGYGHGNHVAGIIGGNGSRSNGAYIGVAPMVNLINVKVSDDQGTATASNVVKGLQWINDNKANYNIRVVNLSLNSAVYAEPDTDPIDAAVEILWFNEVVVVVSAGNDGKNALNPPANDPFVITVGATDDKGTASIADDVVASYSGYDKTKDDKVKIRKPDLVAPGTNIVALMANPNSVLATAHPANVVNGIYFRMSGTSMAAPMASGAAALLLQDEPNLTPDQVKYRLMATANTTWPGYENKTAGAGYLDVYAAVKGTTTASSNTGLKASQLLWTGGQPINWTSVNWNSVNWNSVNWNSVNWNSVNWNSVNWNSDVW
jgi:serine protease AprX